jgi:hypothetical protein
MGVGAIRGSCGDGEDQMLTVEKFKHQIALGVEDPVVGDPFLCGKNGAQSLWITAEAKRSELKPEASRLFDLQNRLHTVCGLLPGGNESSKPKSEVYHSISAASFLP